MNEELAPRIRGMAYKIDKSIAYAWEIVITFGDMDVDDEGAMVIGSPKGMKYVSKKAAIKAMQKEVPPITDIIGKALGYKGDLKDVGFFDLRKGMKKMTLDEFMQDSEISNG